MSSDPTIACPNCGTEIKLNESLAAPLIAATRKDYESRLAKQSADFNKREEEVKAREEQIAKEREMVEKTVSDKLKAERDKLTSENAKREKVFEEREESLRKERDAVADMVAERIKGERARIVTEEAKKAKQALGNDLENKVKELAELQGVIKQRDEKLAEAQKAQAELVRKTRELDDAKREMELSIEKQVTEKLGKTREQAKKEAEQASSLKIIEKDEKIASMQKKIEDLLKKAEQGSQQLQGEAQELQLESMLTLKFPHDTIAPVAKGEHGGDILHRVNTPNGTACGSILWESKRTKNWSDGWLAKLREDQRQAKAEIAVIVSAALPKDVDTFDMIDGVWVVDPRCILPVAFTLRQTLMEVQSVRQAGEGQQTKMEMIYHYLTGPKFRLRVQAIVEAFTDMESDLAKEKKAILKQWAKRETQITRVMEATVGMYGELQGIAGQSLQEIEGLTLDGEEPSALIELIGNLIPSGAWRQGLRG